MNAVARVAMAVHQSMYRMTGGKLGGRVGTAPVLLLTTTGRRTGKARTRPLIYLSDGGDFVVVGSNGGADSHPGWYFNLRSNPAATVQVRRGITTVRAEVATAEKKALLWPRLSQHYSGYETYQKRTRRDMPVVILRPVTPG